VIKGKPFDLQLIAVLYYFCHGRNESDFVSNFVITTYEWFILKNVTRELSLNFHDIKNILAYDANILEIHFYSAMCCAP